MPGAPVVFVKPPRIANADEPVTEDLPAFEQRLAHAIEHALLMPRACCDLTHLSWDALAARVLDVCMGLARS